MKHIAICSSCTTTQNKLKKIIEYYYNNLKMTIRISLFRSGHKFLDSCNHNKYTLVIMHYNPENSTGIELAREYHKKYKTSTPVLFIICYDMCNSMIFPSHTFGYIVQPFKSSDIINILNELTQLQGNNFEVDETFFRTSDGIVHLSTQDIIYFEYRDRKVEIVLSNKKYITHDTIKNIIDSKLTNKFIQPHSAFIVNLAKIKSLNKNYYITMNDDTIIPLAKSRATAFRKKYLAYLKKIDFKKSW